MIYEVPDRLIRKAFKFAIRQIKTSASEYRRRGQSEDDRIKKQIAMGKVAEEAAAHIIPKITGDEILSGVDYKIYKDKRTKSYSADLTGRRKNYHVKSCEESAAERWGTSWVFQRRDPIVTTPVERDMVVLCIVADDLSRVKVFAIEPATELVGRFSQMKSRTLRRTKVALYADAVGGA